MPWAQGAVNPSEGHTGSWMLIFWMDWQLPAPEPLGGGEVSSLAPFHLLCAQWHNFLWPGKSTHSTSRFSVTSKRSLMSYLLPSCQLVFLLQVWPAPGQSCLLSPLLAPRPSDGSTPWGPSSHLGGCQGR